MFNNPGMTITIYNGAVIFGLAGTSALSPQNIAYGFENKDIYPFNTEPFAEGDFLMSSLSERAQVIPCSQCPKRRKRRKGKQLTRIS
ncbi:hypothetical protein HPB48_013595 [Haemaphysalis longicornis]|uniref:Uncharacterized protein n=1 Tax=Haemaphysalis longicornis TaxID=44386 RepID=A0A9J6FQK4_HAELO|nr:hypothetical protein HPB48_013596 [Haemaphysalis longicornis]KAH9364537.1 hypothetical protein HPB48_013595 [Haemaphysalis longicornis]